MKRIIALGLTLLIIIIIYSKINRTELWELFTKQKPGRVNAQEITVYDSVGFALEDFSVLRLVYTLANQYAIGKHIELIPDKIEDSKNLYGLLVRIRRPF